MPNREQPKNEATPKKPREPKSPTPQATDPIAALALAVPKPVATLAKTYTQYSVSFVVVVNVLGFVVAGYHYSQFGVPIASLPFALYMGAGLSFLIITGIHFYCGR